MIPVPVRCQARTGDGPGIRCGEIATLVVFTKYPPYQFWGRCPAHFRSVFNDTSVAYPVELALAVYQKLTALAELETLAVRLSNMKAPASDRAALARVMELIQCQLEEVRCLTGAV